jgi:hypothetical protein
MDYLINFGPVLLRFWVRIGGSAQDSDPRRLVPGGWFTISSLGEGWFTISSLGEGWIDLTQEGF